jgi:hypothetical protein
VGRPTRRPRPGDGAADRHHVPGPDRDTADDDHGHPTAATADNTDDDTDDTDDDERAAGG